MPMQNWRHSYSSFHGETTLEQAHWYAVYTRSHFEKRVAGELAAKNVEHFLPMVPEVHQWKDRKRLIEMPVFPSYVFVRIANSEGNRVHVLRTCGTVRMLGQGCNAEPIPDAEIEAVQQLIRANLPFLRHPFLKEGAAVRVKRGPLRGAEGVLVRMKNSTRLVLTISLLSQSVSAEIDTNDVEVVRSAPPKANPSFCVS